MTSACCVRELSDRELLDGIERVMTRSRSADAAVLAYVAEVDARKLYVPAACSSMHAYCVRVLHMSEDAAFKRIAAARAARRFPAIFAAVEDGRLHLSAVVMLAPHLTDENVDERLGAASHRSKREIEELVAAWAPRPDVPERLERVAEPAGVLVPDEQAPGRVGDSGPATTRTVPLAPERFALQVTIDRETRDKLERAQALMRHRLPSGDLAQVIDRALDALLAELVKEKFAVTERPRPTRERLADERAPDERVDATPARTRHVPAAVRRAVHERDGERCTFVSEDGVRCSERGFLELDHLDAWACGGVSTVDRMRVLCAVHNGHEAERRFGREHVAAKRAEARAARVRARAAPAVAPSTSMPPSPSTPTPPTPSTSMPPTPPMPPMPPPPTMRPSSVPADDFAGDVMLGLRGLGVAPADARDAIARSADQPATTLEERMRAALRALRTTYANRAGESTPRWGGPSARALSGARLVQAHPPPYKVRRA